MTFREGILGQSKANLLKLWFGQNFLQFKMRGSSLISQLVEHRVFSQAFMSSILPVEHFCPLPEVLLRVLACLDSTLQKRPVVLSFIWVLVQQQWTEVVWVAAVQVSRQQILLN